MGFTYIASSYISDQSSGTQLDTTPTLNVQDGDVLACYVAWEAGDSTMDVQDTVGNNDFILLNTISNGNGDNWMKLGHRLIGQANASATFRATWGTSRAFRGFGVMQYRPDSGETISLEAGPSGAEGTGGSMVSGSINPSGNDLILFGAAKNFNASLFGSEQIGGVAADIAIDIGSFWGMWTRVVASAPGSITATATGATATWVADILAIRATLAGLPVPPPGYEVLKSDNPMLAMRR